MGNALVHKGVVDAVQQLRGDWPVVVLGGEQKPPEANVRWKASGNLSRRDMYELLVRAKVLVYPSHYGLWLTGSRRAGIGKAYRCT
jgi:hypothetical protein